MKFSELIDHCVQIVKTFNPVTHTIDSHSDDYMVTIKDPYERVFVKQVFYGCVRYEEFLKVFNKVFFELNPVGTNRNDQYLYMVFAYMSFFRLEELSFEDYRKLILSQDPIKMHPYLQFVWNAESLKSNLREKWMEIYDFDYIDAKIIGGIEKNLQSVCDILRSVEKKATGRVTSSLSMGMSTTQSQSNLSESTAGIQQGRPMSGYMPEGEIATKKVTEAIPFNLTKPKPKVIPQPDALPRETKATAIPKNLFKKNVADIEKEKLDRRAAKTEQIRQDYNASQVKKFELATEGRTNLVDKYEQTKIEVEEKIQAKLNFAGPKARKMPNFDKMEAPVKLTAAAVKREALALKKAQEEEEKRLHDLEYNQRDDTEFATWKREMDERDEILRFDHIQRKKIEMELARENAIMAQEQQVRENRVQAKRMKESANERLEEREKNYQELFTKKIDIVEKVHANREKAGEAVETMKDENRALRDQINREITEALQRKKDEEAAEHKRKQELIRQIRELEKIPIVRTKGFDPTEAGGHGLLEEMSIAELRERIELSKRQVEQETEAKRQANLEKKDKEAEALLSTASMIQEARDARRNLNNSRRQEKRDKDSEMERRKKQIREQQLIEAYEKINKKKRDKAEEDARLAKELKEIRLNRQYMNANAAMVEEKAWKELEAGAERKIENNQNDKLIEQSKLNGIIVKDQTVRATNKKNEVTQKLIYDQEYAGRLDVRKKENELLHKNTLH